MTSPTQQKSNQVPAVLVYGTPTSPELTQASWFRAEDKQAAKAAAVGLKFSVIDIQTEADKVLTVGVHEGVLKGSGRMIVGSVSSEVYRRIEDHVRKTSGLEGSPGSASTEAAVAKPSEQTTNDSATATAATSSTPASKTTETASPEGKPMTAANPVASSTGEPENAAPPKSLGCTAGRLPRRRKILGKRRLGKWLVASDCHRHR